MTLKNIILRMLDSFHGTAFSIIFNKPFISLEPYTGSNRIKTLLSALNMPERMVCQGSAISDLNISFDKANIKLDQLRVKTLDFLETSVQS